MTPIALLTDLITRGATLMADGNAIQVRAPRGVLTDADRVALVAHKAALLGLLADLGTLEADRTAERLRALWSNLSDTERQRLHAEAVAGDTLAGIILAAITVDSQVDRHATGAVPEPRPKRADGTEEA